MVLLGDWNWWAPRPLRKLYARASGVPPGERQPVDQWTTERAVRRRAT